MRKHKDDNHFNYAPGTTTKMTIADTLSRAFPNEEILNQIMNTNDLSEAEDEAINKLKMAITKDNDAQDLLHFIKSGWPKEK